MIFLTLTALLCGLVVTGAAWANGIPTINWRVIGGGGGHAAAGVYTLDGTIGQAEVGAATDGGYELCSGFWCGVLARAPPPGYRIYLPIVLKNYP